MECCDNLPHKRIPTFYGPKAHERSYTAKSNMRVAHVMPGPQSAAPLHLCPSL